ncbi:hypothetical protein H5A44_19265 [Pectobacterium brasiliense]|uniref:hypothetical protein n=1 Tax=Pectobacterium brasiliense TaxID=180957 RepID=UPI001969A981|nr:hypothetical protein [Pectobacterium brasiliense]MBN3344560.1 hypothetical protein [Pectobacterium brasiliense]
MEEVFKVWNDIQSINIDFIIFVFIIIFVLKFKDIFELLFKYSAHRTEQLNTAKKLLEDSGYADSNEMIMIKKMMKSRAVKITTNLISEKYAKFYCYLFSKCTEEEKSGLHKVVPFIDTKDDEFYFNDNNLRKRRLTGVFLALIIIAFSIYMNIIFKGVSDMNISWLFNSLAIIEALFAFHWWINIMPNDIEVKRIKELFKKTNMHEFNNY